MNWISLIPVRSGSKGIPNKNVRLVCGKPLYRHTVDFALNAGTNQIYITTDIQEILTSPKERKIVTIKRKKNLCGDDTLISSVILDFLNGPEGMKISDDQIIVLLQVTSPLRQKVDLLKALNRFTTLSDVDLMMAVTEAENHALKYGYIVDGKFRHISEPRLCFENRQNLPKLFKPTGGFYIFKAGWYRANKSLATMSTGTYELSQRDSLDIDSFVDLERFEAILNKKGLPRENSK